MARLPRDEISVDEELEIFLRGSAECLTREDLVQKIQLARKEGRPLRIKLGADPSAPDIHLGHTVVLWKLKQIQDLGHEVTFLIGDFTGRIGDPTGKNDTRPPLTEAEVLENARTYKEQIFKILDPSKTKVQFNSDWLGKLNFSDVIQLSSKVTVAHMLERQDFQNRYKEHRPIHLHEFFYALAQGYDSVAMETDVELGGLDQRFNFVTTRDLQKAYGQPPEVALMMPILNGTCGTRKMSKSLDNYIGIDEPPQEIFGKVMSLSDTGMWEYYELLSDLDRAALDQLKAKVESKQLHPMEAKKDLAEMLVARFWDPEAGQRARAGFAKTVQKKELPSQIPEVALDLSAGEMPVFLLLKECFGISSSEGRRMVKQKAVRIQGEVFPDPAGMVGLEEGLLVQLGKRRFAKLVSA